MFLKLKNVKGRPDLTDQRCKIVEGDSNGNASAGVWNIETEKGDRLEVKPTSLEFDGARSAQQVREREVILGGIISKPELNGARAQLGSFLPHKQRWKVAVGKNTMLLRSQNLTLAQDGIPLRDPTVVSPCPELGQSGLFANQDVKRGQIIFEEEPFLTVPVQGSFESQTRSYADVFMSLGEADRAKALDMCQNSSLRLPADKVKNQPGADKWTRCPNQQAAFEKLGLDKYVDPAHHSGVWKFMIVMQTNAFGMKTSSQGLFATLCRANHSCQPNALRYDNGIGKILIALQDIRAGEEIYINYMSDTQLLEPRQQRQEFISTWGFVCNCQLCSQPGDDVRLFPCPVRCGGSCIGIPDGLSPCSACEVEYASSTQTLADEARLIAKLLEIDLKPFLITVNPGVVDELRQAMAAVMDRMHWGFARLDDIAAGYHLQKQNLKKALSCMTSELEFWAHHMKRCSQQAAWKRKLRADVMVDSGSWASALDEYVRALHELDMVMPEDSQHCTDIRNKIGQVLAFRGSKPANPIKNEGYPANKGLNNDGIKDFIKSSLGGQNGNSEELMAQLAGLMKQHANVK